MTDDTPLSEQTLAPNWHAQVRIGGRLRHARLSRGLSLKQLAEMVGCSISTLSKIESQKANPSITMLHRICSALESNLSTLFSGEEAPDIVTRAGERPVIATDQLRSGEGITLERLVPYSAGNLLQGNVHVIEAGGGSDTGLQHEGEELGYLIEGELDLTIDGMTYRIGEGDSFFFHSNRAHSYHNPGTTVTRVIWVNTPPTF